MRPLYHFVLWALPAVSTCTAAFAQSKAARPAKPATTVNAVNQYAAIDKVALQIPDSSTATTNGIAAYINAHFSQDSEKARAAFIWVATNISYDIENMFALNFHEKKEDKIAKPLKTRKGICENYAALFNDICSKAGIKSFVVEGYTKQNGFTDYIPHAWCAALIDTTWYLYDPTWGSGYIANKQFVKKINNSYFQASPRNLIKSHMPFDYLWQFLYYPVSNQEFYEGNTRENTSKPLFNYKDSIAIYEKQDKIAYYTAAATRIEKNGLKNAMLFDRLQQLRREVEIEKQNRMVEAQNKIVNLYNAALENYNDGVNAFNAFIDYRNKQFKPERSDPEIQAMLDACANQVKEANSKLAQIKNPDASTANLIVNFRKQIGDLTARVDEQQEWLKKYFSKGKGGRRSMFTKYTWFGIPLN
jgi:hypothetical protein